MHGVLLKMKAQMWHFLDFRVFKLILLYSHCIIVIDIPIICRHTSASKNTDSSVFYTEIETKILNTDSDPKNTDRDPNISARYT